MHEALSSVPSTEKKKKCKDEYKFRNRALPKGHSKSEGSCSLNFIGSRVPDLFCAT
jgi:hypothetical protein